MRSISTSQIPCKGRGHPGVHETHLENRWSRLEGASVWGELARAHVVPTTPTLVRDALGLPPAWPSEATARPPAPSHQTRPHMTS